MENPARNFIAKSLGAPWLLDELLQFQPQMFGQTFVTNILVGLCVLLKPSKTTSIIALVFLFLVWWFGQDFGSLSTLIVGTPTDPNTAPLLALLVVPLFFNNPPSIAITSQVNT